MQNLINKINNIVSSSSIKEIYLDTLKNDFDCAVAGSKELLDMVGENAGLTTEEVNWVRNGDGVDHNSYWRSCAARSTRMQLQEEGAIIVEEGFTMLVRDDAEFDAAVAKVEVIKAERQAVLSAKEAAKAEKELLKSPTTHNIMTRVKRLMDELGMDMDSAFSRLPVSSEFGTTDTKEAVKVYMLQTV